MIAVVDRIVQYPHRYQLRNVATGEILGTFDLDPVLGTVQVGGTKINKELFDSIAADINKKVSLNGGELKDTIVTFENYVGSENIISGEKASIMMAKIKKKLNDHDNFIATKGKPNGFASLDGSGKVNETAKKAVADSLGNVIDKHYATKKEINESMKVVKDCKDEVGITGYKGCSEGLAFESAKSVFELPMINGQTGRASENLLDIPDKSETTINGITYSVKNGVIKLNGTSTDWLEIYSPVLNFEKGNYTLINYISGNTDKTVGSWIRDYNPQYTQFGNDMLNENIYFKSFNTQYSLAHFRISIKPNTTLDNYIVKPMLVKGTYTLENIPAWKPFNDNLVNSHCVVKTTGVNIWDEEWEEGSVAFNSGENENSNSRIRSKNYIDVLPNKHYYSKCNLENALRFSFYDINKNFISSIATQDFITPNNCYYIRFRSVDAYGPIYKKDIIINYDNPIPYTPHTEDVIADIGELGFNDSIDNVAKKKYVGTSKIITLDGSPDEKWLKGGSLFVLNITSNLAIKNSSTVNVKSNYLDRSLVDLYNGKDGVAITNNQILIHNISFTTIEELKQWLSKNPIQLSYALATITEIDMSSNPLQFTMRIEKGGMELQQPFGNALPYNLTKIYSVNKAAQIDSNSNANARQNEEISALENRASSLETTTTNLENNKADTTYVDEELGKKQPSGDYATKTELTEGLAKKQDSGDYQPAGDYATNTALTEGLATKLGSTETAADSSKLGGTDAGDYALKTDIPTDNNQLTNGAGYLTKHQDISGKQDKEDNLLETTDKTVVGAINELNTNKANTTDIPTVPTKVSELENDSGFVTDISGKQDSTDNSLETTVKTVVGAINELNTNKANASTTLAGYGITDAKIDKGTITLGDNSITPITDVSDKLGTTDTAADSKKLGGVAASEYAKTTEVYHNLSIVVDTNNGATTDLGDMFVFYDNPKLFMITFTIGFGAIAMRKTMTFLSSSETFIFAIMTTIYRVHFKLNYNPNDGMLSLEIAETTNNFKDIIVNDIAVIY